MTNFEMPGPSSFAERAPVGVSCHDRVERITLEVAVDNDEVVLSWPGGRTVRFGITQALRLLGVLDEATLQAACNTSAFAQTVRQTPNRWMVKGRNAKNDDDCTIIVLAEPAKNQVQLCVHGYPSATLSPEVAGHLAVALACARAGHA
ncbi:hypothetical protein GTS_44540 [Gandjariella thermophila]|uniref:Uncharacterized protein n=1 Tax=Gandjariella thermophila TaxID=1931992 RepID=A0A4D4J844_9PSEU|nr:hypothetical protein GTS_44540 [Gandjariella thermophila]